jgi:2-dehydro-3-deoxygalactonokinase
MTPEWIAADWGTSTSDFEDGATPVRPLTEILPPSNLRWLKRIVPATTISTLRLGQAPYQTTPCAVCPSRMVIARPPFAIVHVIPGIQTDPADVMRGEETQIAVISGGKFGWDGVICLPEPTPMGPYFGKRSHQLSDIHDG